MAQIAAPPFHCTLEFHSTEQHSGVNYTFYSKNGTDYQSAMTDAEAVMTALLQLMPPDVWCAGATVRNDDPAVKRDSYIHYYKQTDNKGTYVPNTSGTAHSAPFQNAISMECIDSGTLQRLFSLIRPLPLNLIDSGTKLTPDVNYLAGLTAYEAQLIAKTVFPRLAASGTFYNIVPFDTTRVNFEITERDCGQGGHPVRGRRRSSTGFIPTSGAG